MVKNNEVLGDNKHNNNIIYIYIYIYIGRPAGCGTGSCPRDGWSAARFREGERQRPRCGKERRSHFFPWDGH